MNGDCRLCLAPGVELRDSHIMPKFSYRRARASGPGGDPVHIEDGKAFQTSLQRKEHLLCEGCEQRIGTVETAVSLLLPADDEQEAPILGLLGLVTDVSSGGYRQVPLRDVNDADLAYFALSVFWRASLSSRYPMTLQPGDAEMFRRYLLGELSLPMNLALVAIYYDVPFNDDTRLDLRSTCIGPQLGTEGDGSTSYRFVVNGLHFHLELGEQLPEVFVESCLVRTRSMFLARQEALVELLAEPMSSARVVDKLRRRFERTKPT